MRPREGGFTLVETLVALALVGLVSLLVFEGMRFTQSAWVRRANRSDAAAVAIQTADILRLTLKGAITVPQGAYIAGGPDGLTLVSELRLGEGPAVLRQIRLAQEQGSLLVQSRPVDADGVPWQTERRLQGSVDRISFRYLDASGVWHSAWEKSGTLPMLVEMRVMSSTLRHWPAIVVAPGNVFVSY